MDAAGRWHGNSNKGPVLLDDLQADTPRKEAVVPIIRPDRFASPEALAAHVKAVMLAYPLTNAILLPSVGDEPAGCS